MRLPRKRRQQFITVFSVRTTHHNWLGKFTICPKHEFRSKLIEIFSILSPKNYQFYSFQSKMSKYFKSEFNLLLLIVFINNWPMVTIWYQTHLWRTSPRTLFVRLTVRSRFYRRPRSQSFLHVYLCFGKIWTFGGLHVPNVQTVPRDCIKVLVEKNVEFVPTRDKIKDRIFNCRTLVIYLYLLII